MQWLLNKIIYLCITSSTKIIKNLKKQNKKKLEAILKNVDRLSNKESVLKSLKTIKVELENIKQEISSYEDVIVDESTYITPDILGNEE